MAKVCANVDLSEHVVDVIFTIFDEDGDGALSNKEFVAVMKNKLKRNIFIIFWHLYFVHHMSTTNPESTNFLEVWWLYLHFCYVLGWQIIIFLKIIFCVLGISYANLFMTKMEYWIYSICFDSFSTEQHRTIIGPKSFEYCKVASSRLTW